VPPVEPAVLDKLRALVGPGALLTGVDLSRYATEGRSPAAAVFPSSVDEVAAVVACAADAGLAVVPWGGGTAPSVGAPPAQPALVLGLGHLGRLVEHEPGDLTATVEAGMTMAALQAALGARGQWLSLDPPDAALATIGGVVAANASGPRRHLYGTARDLVIGVTVVTAEGAVVKGGGKVVKNVAGYDLPKLFIGSFGTLGVIVEVTLKLRPRPDAERLLAARFERLNDAGAAVRAMLASDLIPSAVDLLDAAASAALGLGGGPALVVGFDGLAEQVAWQATELGRLVAAHAGREPVALQDEAWAGLSTAARAAFDVPAVVMTLSVLPALVAETMERGADGARQRGLRSAWTAHAGVGAMTAALALPHGAASTADVVATLTGWRALARAGGGHATLAWAPLAVKTEVPVWDDAGAAGRIMQRIKAQLDPRNILNPGRFVAGI
jgi:glycolate oxidase FAD binding subunit